LKLCRGQKAAESIRYWA